MTHKNFESNEEFWQAVNEFIADLDKSGNLLAAEELKKGKSLCTGLTDGWADFLESIEKVKKQYSPQLNSSQKSTLKNIHQEIYQRTYCTYNGPGWQIQARINRMQGNLYRKQQMKEKDRQSKRVDDKTGAHNWSVWRQDDNGNVALVKSGLTKAEAAQLVEAYEARGHKQTYWAKESQ